MYNVARKSAKSKRSIWQEISKNNYIKNPAVNPHMEAEDKENQYLFVHNFFIQFK